MARRASAQAPRPRGRHSLRSRSFARELVRDAEVAPGMLVLDLGAGSGMLTGALLAAGARVRAVELDPAALRQLHARFDRQPRVEILAADATQVALPAEPFAVVANLPFASGTAILRRLLGEPDVPLTQLDAVVEWGLAAKRAAVWPSTLLGCTWSAWYELRLVRRVSQAAFAPPPNVDAAVLRARRRPAPLVPPAEAGRYVALLRRAFASQAPLERMLPRGVVVRAAHELGFDPRAQARDLDPRQWARLYAAVRSASSHARGAAPRRRSGSRR